MALLNCSSLVIDIDRGHGRKFVRWRSLRFAESLLVRNLAYIENI
jgi:hypothetical protein